MNIAIIENDKVINVIVGEPETVAELFEQTQPVTETTGPAWTGARFNGEKFEPQQPYPSWVWNEETFSYDPPKPKPEGIYRWDETAGDWVEHLAPYPSWTYNADTGNYDPPQAYPEDGQPYTWDEATLDWVLFQPTDTEA